MTARNKYLLICAFVLAAGTFSSGLWLMGPSYSDPRTFFGMLCWLLVFVVGVREAVMIPKDQGSVLSTRERISIVVFVAIWIGVVIGGYRALGVPSLRSWGLLLAIVSFGAMGTVWFIIGINKESPADDGPHGWRKFAFYALGAGIASVPILLAETGTLWTVGPVLVLAVLVFRLAVFFRRRLGKSNS